MTVAVLPHERRRSTILGASFFSTHARQSSERKTEISKPLPATYLPSSTRSGIVDNNNTDGFFAASAVSACQSEPIVAEELRSRALALMDALFNTPSLDRASTFLSPNLTFQRDSPSQPVTLYSRAEFLSFWQELQRMELAGNWECEIKEAAADQQQRKVWVVGEMRNVDEGQEAVARVETVEMLSFDEYGKICDIMDYQRRVRRGRKNED